MTTLTLQSTAAPADCRPHAPWSRARTALAYAVLIGLALMSIWLVDQRMDTLAIEEQIGVYWGFVGHAVSRVWWMAPPLFAW